MITSNHTPILLCLVALVCAACSESERVACFDLQEQRRFGQLYDASTSTNAQPAESAAGVLGDIRGVVADPDGTLFVLDRSTHRIVVFGRDGSVERVILGREGEGPGEFRLPMHLTSAGRGVSVLDYDLKRITEFDSAGQPIRLTRLQTPSPWRHLIRNDTAWVTFGLSGATSQPILYTVTLGAGQITAGPVLVPEDQAFGGGLGSAFGDNGEIVVNTARPGVWMRNGGAGWTRVGKPLYPDDRAPFSEQVGPQVSRETPAQHNAAGLVTLGDSLVLQGVSSYPRPFDWADPPGRDEVFHSLAVFRSDGEHLATLRLAPGVFTTSLSADRPSGRIFMHATDPFPQVVEFKLIQCAEQ